MTVELFYLDEKAVLPLGAYVKSSDYDALAAQAQALLDGRNALEARVAEAEREVVRLLRWKNASVTVLSEAQLLAVYKETSDSAENKR